MSKICILFIFGILSGFSFSQNNTLTEIRKWSDAGQHQKIIDKYAPKAKDLSAKSLYFVGLAYYMTQKDSACIHFMDLSIKKDPKDPGPHFIKASTLNFTKKYEQAIPEFRESIRLNPDHSKSYSGLGDAYFELKQIDLALEAYQKATEKPDAPERAYAMVAQIYSAQKDQDKSYLAYQAIKAHVSKTSATYMNALFNIGVIEFYRGNYDAAESSYLELVSLSPTDYSTFAKLVQVYFRKNDPEKLKFYRDKLYEAHKHDVLRNTRLQDMFCFDQFSWQDKQVQAYERYDNDESRSHFKHLFYVVNPDQTLDCIIQTEFSPQAAQLGQVKYSFGMLKEKEHAAFPKGFDELPSYEDLKATALDILDGKIKPAVISEIGE